MDDVSHTHPKTGESFGESRVYERGTVLVADGGTADSPSTEEAEADDDHENEPMGAVDHTPRAGAPEANEAYTRGGEHERDPGDDTDEKES